MASSAATGAHATANDPALQQRFKSEVLRQFDATPFIAPRWLTNAHGQTIGSRYGHRVMPASMQLERWTTPDDDFIRVHRLDANEETPAALLLHGLEGSVESTYIARLIHYLHDAGFSVFAMEHRSCGGEMNRAKRLYHSGETTDIDFAVCEFGRRFPGRPLYIAGYSLGANQAAKWLGEQGANTPSHVQAAAIVSAPYDLIESGPFIDTGIRRQIYVKHFLRKLIPKAIEKERQYPGSLDIDRIRRCATFREFDTYGTAALHGFDDADDYYNKSACGQFLHAIRRPTMLLSAADDPFNPGWTLPRKIADESPWLHPQFTERGGHVGFVHRAPGEKITFWAEDQVTRFFTTYRRLLTK